MGCVLTLAFSSELEVSTLCFRFLVFWAGSGLGLVDFFFFFTILSSGLDLASFFGGFSKRIRLIGNRFTFWGRIGFSIWRAGIWRFWNLFLRIFIFLNRFLHFWENEISFKKLPSSFFVFIFFLLSESDSLLSEDSSFLEALFSDFWFSVALENLP